MRKIFLLLVCFISVGAYAETFEEIRQSCVSGNGMSCMRVGNMYFRQGPNDGILAERYYKQSCDLNYARGCSNLGFMYNDGGHIRQNYRQARYYYLKACDLKDPIGCYNIATLFYNGVGGITRNLRWAKDYFGKSCDYGYGSGCQQFKAVSNLLLNTVMQRGSPPTRVGNIGGSQAGSSSATSKKASTLGTLEATRPNRVKTQEIKRRTEPMMEVRNLNQSSK